MIAKLNPFSGWLLVALVVTSGWGAFATYRWATASSRCDTRIAEAKTEAVTDELERQAKADRIAAGIFDGSRATTRGQLGDAAGNTHTRETVIREVRVTGACVMPEGLPDLAPAIEEARAAARD